MHVWWHGQRGLEGLHLLHVWRHGQRGLTNPHHLHGWRHGLRGFDHPMFVESISKGLRKKATSPSKHFCATLCVLLACATISLLLLIPIVCSHITTVEDRAFCS